MRKIIKSRKRTEKTGENVEKKKKKKKQEQKKYRKKLGMFRKHYKKN